MHHFSCQYLNLLHPAASNGDLFFQNRGTRGTDLGCPPPPHSYATGLDKDGGNVMMFFKKLKLSPMQDLFSNLNPRFVHARVVQYIADLPISPQGPGDTIIFD